MPTDMSDYNYECLENQGKDLEPIMDDRNELIRLRISIARIAQMHGVDNFLHVTGLGFFQLLHLAQTCDRGWNDLAWLCVDK